MSATTRLPGTTGISDIADIDNLLASTLAGETTTWPTQPINNRLLLERIAYHGIAGLLFQRAAQLSGWPQSVLDALRGQTIATTMWEMRHKIVLSNLLSRFAEAGIQPLILKGSAFAYDLYTTAASRTRGDTDLLIALADLPKARELLPALNYQLISERHDHHAQLDDLQLQELWELVAEDGSRHAIDLHWQALNSLALQGLFDFDECTLTALSLPRLHPAARGLDRPRALLHACLHRAQHISSPYIVDGVTYYGGDRLIWAHDIHLLTANLSAAEWQQLCQLAIDGCCAGVCLNGLEIAQARLGSQPPTEALERLRKVPAQAATHYLLGGRQVHRTLMDLRAVPGLRRKLRFILMRLFPSAAFLRDKYPQMHSAPLLLLHLRRLLDFIRRRPDGAQH
jgi:hypothetical protein